MWLVLLESAKYRVRVLYPGYHGSLVTAQKSGYDRFPPAANCWGTTHPVPDMAPPLLTEEEGSPTYKQPNPGVIHVNASPCYGRSGQEGSCHLSARSVSLPDPGRAWSPSHITQRLYHRVCFTGTRITGSSSI
jgi:hypothetical protein